MQEELTKYTEFYKAAHTGYVLDWDHSLGSATLKARFNAGVKELSVSLYQTIVLLLFNEAVALPFGDIKEQTRMGASSYLVNCHDHSLFTVFQQRMVNCGGSFRVLPVERRRS